MLLRRVGAEEERSSLTGLGGAELEARDEDGRTAFFYACDKGDAECIALLVRAGCDTAAKNDHGYTGLMNAVRSKNAAAVQAVLMSRSLI